MHKSALHSEAFSELNVPVQISQRHAPFAVFKRCHKIAIFCGQIYLVPFAFQLVHCPFKIPVLLISRQSIVEWCIFCLTLVINFHPNSSFVQLSYWRHQCVIYHVRHVWSWITAFKSKRTHLLNSPTHTFPIFQHTSYSFRSLSSATPFDLWCPEEECTLAFRTYDAQLNPKPMEDS